MQDSLWLHEASLPPSLSVLAMPLPWHLVEPEVRWNCTFLGTRDPKEPHCFSLVLTQISIQHQHLGGEESSQHVLFTWELYLKSTAADLNCTQDAWQGKSKLFFKNGGKIKAWRGLIPSRVPETSTWNGGAQGLCCSFDSKSGLSLLNQHACLCFSLG